MREFNLAIVYHGVKKSWRDDIEDFLKDEWDDHIKDVADTKLRIHPIESVTDEQVQLKIFKNYSNGTPALGTVNGKDITRKAIPTPNGVYDMGKYQMVLFAYDAEESDLWNTLYDSRGRNLGKGEVTSWSFYNEIFLDTEYTELEVNDRPQEGKKKAKTSALHELMHALVKRCHRNGYNKVVDHMDATVVDGEKIEYYKNSRPFTKDGNYERTLNSITEHNGWDVICENIRLNRVIDALKNQTPVVTPTPPVTPPVVEKTTNFPVEIIVHHTGGTDKNPLEDTSHHTAAIIKNWHVNGLGWSDIGYHWVIEKDGKIVAGRPETKEGAHTLGENARSIGICLSGNFDATMPTEAQKKSLETLLKEVMARYDIPDSKIFPHRHFSSKTCFGNKLPDDWARNLVKPAEVRPLAHVPTSQMVDELMYRITHGLLGK